MVAIYFFILYGDTSLQQDNAVVSLYVSLLSNFYLSFHTTFLSACLLYLGFALLYSVYGCLGLYRGQANVLFKVIFTVAGALNLFFLLPKAACKI